MVSAVTQHGGFSPGAACRLRLADGRRAFLKAVAASQDGVAFGLHRREAEITASLPAGCGVPRLLGFFDDGAWVALLMSDVEGRQPGQPWRLPELTRVLDELSLLHERLTPCPVDAAQPIAVTQQEALGGWRRLAARQDPPLDAWSLSHLQQLADLEALWSQAAAGPTLLHTDLRADNILLTGDEGVVFVDWAWACTGAAWVDVVTLAPSVAMQGGPDLQWLLDRTRSVRTADPDAVTAVAAAVAGYFTEQATLPAIPGLPRLRHFQAAQGKHARAWLRRRTGWR
ncbi:Ser/Thr protein kinase RdoA (MazF antagonist) [Streptomyces sp. SAI-144]|nr:Ser/Thr protein kinase RdoA (MazF antagonist) [Streptomyces sp. SAI-144]